MLDQKISNELKILALEMINNAGSGHSGSVLSLGDAVYTLYTRHILTDGTKNINRDRFVLSAGHACASLYSVLAGLGHIPFEEVKTFRKFGGLLSGHPEIEIEPVDAGTGLLGQGIANAVGMAIAETIMNAKFKLSHYTYCLAGDGCLQEGVAMEALSIAGLYNLNKFILLYDKNNITLDGKLSDSSSDDIVGKLKSMNLNVIECDGHNIEKIDKAIIKAKKSKNKPTVIILNTVIGKDTKCANSNKSHAVVYTEEDICNLKNLYGVNNQKLCLNESTKKYLIEIKSKKHELLKERENIFNENLKNNPELEQKFKQFIKNSYKSKIKYQKGKQEIRKANNFVLNEISKKMDNIINLSADLSSSTKVIINEGGEYTAKNRLGKNIAMGIREHAMGAIANGIALHGGLVPVTSTYLVFANYMLPAIRMASIMDLPVIFTFCHSSVYEVRDGVSHIPVEHLDQLRIIPNLTTFRVHDMAECKAAYDWFYQNQKPICLCVSKTANEQILSSEDMSVGAYFATKDDAEINIMSSGSDVDIALELKTALAKQGVVANIISMLSMEVFEAQPQSVKAKFLKKPLFVVETSTCVKYYKYTAESNIFNVSKFGVSGDSSSIKNYYGYDVNVLAKKIIKILKNMNK